MKQLILMTGLLMTTIWGYSQEVENAFTVVIDDEKAQTLHVSFGQTANHAVDIQIQDGQHQAIFAEYFPNGKGHERYYNLSELTIGTYYLWIDEGFQAALIPVVVEADGLVVELSQKQVSNF